MPFFYNMNTEIINKKRGRKPKIKEQVSVNDTIIPKKRGRKPKNKDLIIKTELPKKRGRKPKEKFGTLDNNIVLQDDEHIILHLPLKNISFVETDAVIDKPEPFESVNILFSKYNEKKINDGILLNSDCDTEPDHIPETNSVMEQDKDKVQEQVQVQVQEQVQEQVRVRVQDQEKVQDMDCVLDKIIKERQTELNTQSSISQSTNSKIFMEFIEYNKTHKWPASTNIDCLWDCHSFDSEPYGIPIHKINGIYHMFGNFCSAECAAAYNFEMNHDSNVWERYSILNYLYNNNEPTFIANSKLLLKRFGGRYNIEEYRAISNEKKKYNVVLPPVISVIPTIEEINYDLFGDGLFNIDKDRIKKASDDYKLKRSKPLPDYKNTLESCMNLKYV